MAKKKTTGNVNPNANVNESKKKAKKVEYDIHQLILDTYENAKGRTVARIAGFDPKDKRLKDAAGYHAVASYRMNGNKRELVLLFGSRYTDLARRLHKEWGGANGNANPNENENQNNQPSDISFQTSTEPRYTMAEIAAMMKRVLAGEKCEELAAIREVLMAA